MAKHLLSNRGRSRWLLAAILLASSATVGRAADDKENPPVRTFIGAVQGAPDSARIALMTEDNILCAYTCSEDADFNKGHAQWICQVKVAKNGEFKGTSKEGLELQGQIKGIQVEGKLTEKGKPPLTFQAVLVAPDGLVGLYRAEDTVDGKKYVAGWIVDRDLQRVGTVRDTKSGQVTTLPSSQLRKDQKTKEAVAAKLNPKAAKAVSGTKPSPKTVE